MMMRSLCALAGLLLLGMAGCATAPWARPRGLRTTLLVQVPAEPAWQDMAYLAAIPAAMVANDGAPSLIAVDPGQPLSPEIGDYLRRYRPDAVMLLGDASAEPSSGGPSGSVVRAVSADEAACALSERFWRTSATAVICGEDDYEAGLVAAPLAARLRVPLLLAGAQGLSSLATNELRRLQAEELLAIGSAGGVESLQLIARRVTRLRNAREVMGWARTRGWPVTYVAALNPLDRSRTVIRKLSLAGALLAAGRGGLVAPLAYDVQWKAPFDGVELTGEPPAGLPANPGALKAGRLKLGKAEYAYVLAGKAEDRSHRVYIDRNGDGKYDGPGEGPLATGDAVELDGRRYAVTLGRESGMGQADVRLTWPTAEQLIGDLRGHYEALGAVPEHLCLVGFPDAVPQAIIGQGAAEEEQPSDLPYANADADEFAEIGVARVVAESASFATLFASRVLTYSSLLDPDWKDRAGIACWENTYGKMFENAGFTEISHHDEKDLKWAVAPSNGAEGQKDGTFSQDSPLARCAVLAHENHSGWYDLGGMFTWDAKVLLAPVIVESGGCSTASLDRDEHCRSVIARFLRKGAVAYSGNGRLGQAECELQRQEFWNGVLAGLSIGQAHRRSINSATVTILDKQGDAGSYRYQRYIRTQFGDPAFVLRVPGRPRSAPARSALSGNTLTVHAPEQWWPVKIQVPPDWKKWADKDLYVVRGAGTYARRSWCEEGYDKEDMYATAEFTTRRHVSKIEQVQQPPAPLGWNGSYYVDEHADGSRSYRWSVRLADFDQVKGVMINAVNQLEYRISY